RTQDSGWTESPRLLPTSVEYRFPCKRNDVLIIEGRCANSLVKGRWRQIKKVADDSPTEHLTGNLLTNPGFGYLDDAEFESGYQTGQGWSAPTIFETGLPAPIPLRIYSHFRGV